MKWEKSDCPKCGKPVVGTLEVIPGVAGVEPDGKGGYDYNGSTDVEWNGQKSVKDSKGRNTLVCENNHTWLSIKTEH